MSGMVKCEVSYVFKTEGSTLCLRRLEKNTMDSRAPTHTPKFMISLKYINKYYTLLKNLKNKVTFKEDLISDHS